MNALAVLVFAVCCPLLHGQENTVLFGPAAQSGPPEPMGGMGLPPGALDGSTGCYHPDPAPTPPDTGPGDSMLNKNGDGQDGRICCNNEAESPAPPIHRRRAPL